MFRKIAVLGLGRVGGLAAELLSDVGFDVAGLDARPIADPPFPVHTVDLGDARAMGAALAGREAVLSCLPYAFNKEVASAAHALGLHYFDLTEDVATTRHIRALSETAKAIMAPQCGLAPGFVGIVGAHLARQFERVRSIRLRVGALPQHPTGLLGYAFNWSPEGVVNEYLNDCEVIEEGVVKTVSAMEWLETVYINGVRLEAFTTSGGLGTMCETFANQVETSTTKACAIRATRR
jgi:saccharopine dehydrogenase (NAD+, L-lysine-forming)